MSSFLNTKCSTCGIGILLEAFGTTIKTHLHKPEFKLPDDIAIPKCNYCGDNFIPADMEDHIYGLTKVEQDAYDSAMASALDIQVTQAKRVTTRDSQGNVNGFLLELQKDGDNTTSYLTCCNLKTIKGYHLHKVRDANYVCIRGSIKISLFTMHNNEVVNIEKILGEGDKLHIPTYVATALINDGAEPAWIINFPNPSYDPNLKDEQVEFVYEDFFNGLFETFMKESNAS